MLARLGVSKGDRVIIYMPMIPQTVFAMLACARLGAVHSVVFGGFAPLELAKRIERQAGFERVVHKGDGLFDVTFRVAGRLGPRPPSARPRPRRPRRPASATPSITRRIED